MKRREVFFLFLILLLIIPFTSAVSFDMKTNYSQGETLIAKISGNFITPVQASNIYFYRDVYLQVPMQYDIAKLGDDYYLYAQLANKVPGNYSIVIKNVVHTEFTNTTSADIIQNFSITQDRADFSVNPGFVSPSNDFSITITNLKDSSINVAVLVNSNGNQVSVPASQTKQVPFSYSSFTNQLTVVEFSEGNTKYDVPVFVSSAQGGQTQTQTQSFAFEPGILGISVGTGQTATRTIYLTNTGQETLDNIAISVSSSLSQYVTLSATTVSELENDSSVPITLSISSQNTAQNLTGVVRATINSLSLLTDSQISLNYLANYTAPANQSSSTVLTCASINAKIMNSSCTSCNGFTADSSEGTCCVGTCSSQGGGSSSTVIIIIVVLVLAVVVFLLIRKARKGAKGAGTSGVDLLKIAAGKK
ncbi:MAG TPA: hypothetical protein VMC80_00515 [Patescibacteria group bacterium]|nr:hypothetical protein [Patescibacteria group bacterium]